MDLVPVDDAGEEREKSMTHNPLDTLTFPVSCGYLKCGAGPFTNGIQVDEHITEEHLPQSIWSFALEQMKPFRKG